MAIKLKVDQDMCVGCGLCAGTYDKAFEINEDGKAIVIGELDEASAEDVIANCPAAAIIK